MSESCAIIVGAVISGVIGILTALMASWLQARATRAAVCTCMISEIRLLLSGISPLINSKDKNLGAAVAAMSTLGTLKTRVYQGLIPQLGALGSELAGEIVGLYSNLEHLIERGQEIEREGSKLISSNPGNDETLEMAHLTDHVQKFDRLNAEASEWLEQLRDLHNGMKMTLTHLQKTS